MESFLFPSDVGCFFGYAVIHRQRVGGVSEVQTKSSLRSHRIGSFNNMARILTYVLTVSQLTKCQQAFLSPSLLWKEALRRSTFIPVPPWFWLVSLTSCSS